MRLRGGSSCRALLRGSALMQQHMLRSCVGWQLQTDVDIEPNSRWTCDRSSISPALTPRPHTGGLANPRQGAPQKAAPKMLWQLKYKMV